MTAPLRLFKATDVFTITGRGTVWDGVCPFDWNRSEGLAAWEGEWLISHPMAAHDSTYTVIGVECYCIERIRAGMPIGIIVRQNVMP